MDGIGTMLSQPIFSCQFGLDAAAGLALPTTQLRTGHLSRSPAPDPVTCGGFHQSSCAGRHNLFTGGAGKMA